MPIFPPFFAAASTSAKCCRGFLRGYQKLLYNVVIRCIFGGLSRQIRRASAAENQHVDLILHMLRLEASSTFTPAVRTFTFPGFLLVNTPTNSISSLWAIALSTPLPRFPYPKIPILILIFSPYPLLCLCDFFVALAF